MKIRNNKNGFTLIELIMVMIILGIMAAVAIPRYLETIEKSEVAAEDAVVNNIMVALENYAQNKMLTEGRRYWPTNPFDALVTKPQTYTLDGTPCDTDNEWTFVEDASDGTFTGYISHQRADNTRYQWSYNKGINTGTDDDVTGTLYERTELGNGGTSVLFK
tara:strand:- start:71 stop:556 length:486 start_codon:yes stop_codon:yes gene_type:complete